MQRSTASVMVAALVLAGAACGSDELSSGGSSDDWCSFAQRVEDSQNELDTLEPSGDLDSFADSFREAFTTFNSLLSDASGAAPSEIRDDVELVAESFQQVTGVLEDADFDLFAVDPAALEELDSPEVEQAIDNIEEYNERVCGISPDGDDAEGSDGDEAEPSDVFGDPDDAGDGDAGGDDAGDDDAGEVFEGDSGSDWCQLARSIDDVGDTLGDEQILADPAVLQATFEELQRVLAQAVLVAPSEISDDVRTFADGFEQFEQALRDADYSFLDTDLSVLEELSDEMDAASENIEAYNEQVCGIPADDTFDDDDGTEMGDEDLGDDDGFDPGAGTVREQIVASLVQSGFTEDEAECLVERLDFADPSALADTAAMFEVFEECGIDLARLGEIGG